MLGPCQGGDCLINEHVFDPEKLNQCCGVVVSCPAPARGREGSRPCPALAPPACRARGWVQSCCKPREGLGLCRDSSGRCHCLGMVCRGHSQLRGCGGLDLGAVCDSFGLLYFFPSCFFPCKVSSEAAEAAAPWLCWAGAIGSGRRQPGGREGKAWGSSSWWRSHLGAR